jgi:chromosome segregation ATPase
VGKSVGTAAGVRSRLASPVVRSSLKKPASALKRITEGRRWLTGSPRDGNGDGALFRFDDNDKATNNSNAGGYKDYNSYDNPTPVKEARRLSFMFQQHLSSSSSPLSSTKLFQQPPTSAAAVIDVSVTARDTDKEQLRRSLAQAESRASDLQQSLDSAQKMLAETVSDSHRTRCENWQVENDASRISLEKIEVEHREELHDCLQELVKVKASQKEVLADHEKASKKVESEHQKKIKESLDAHESTISELKIKMAQIELQVKHERDLRTKADKKAGEERVERIALLAQLNAQGKEHFESEKLLREAMESLRHELNGKDHIIGGKDSELKKCEETIVTLEAQLQLLKLSLSKQISTLDASKEEESARLRDIIANLKSTLKSEAERLQDMGVANHAKVQELQETIHNLLIENKR